MLRAAAICRISIIWLMVLICLPQVVWAGAANNTVRFNTILGTIDIDLYNSDTPITVQNFLTYVNSGAYNTTVFHRLIKGFVLQGGGYTYNSTTHNLNPHIALNAPIQNEFLYSNVRGTIAMAKMDGDPNSATSEFFVNLRDNSLDLDSQNGGFTVFGAVTSMTVVDQFAGAPPDPYGITVVNAGGALNSLPLINYQGNQYFESINTVTILPTGPQPWKLTTGGSWNTVANWSYGYIASTNGQSATFGNNLVGAGNVDLGVTPQTVAMVQFAAGSNNGAYTITGSGTGILTLDGGGGAAKIELNQVGTNSQSQTIGAPISYATNTTIDNKSTTGAQVVLSGIQNWNTSTVSVAAGKVKFNNASTGSVGSGAALAVSSGATVELAGTTSAVLNLPVTNDGTFSVTGTNQAARTLAGSGGTTIAAAGALTVGTQTSGTLTAGTGAIIQGTLTVNGTLRNDGNATFAATFVPASAAAVSLSGSTATALSVGTTGNAKLGNITFTNATGGGTVADGGKLTAANIDGSTSAIFSNGKNATTTVNHLVIGGALSLLGDSSSLTGKVTISNGGSGAAGATTGTSRIGSLSIASNNLALPTPLSSGVPYNGSVRTYYSTLDLVTNDLIINSGTLADVSDMIRSGRAGNWSGKGLNSSFIGASAYALGAIRNDSNPITSAVEGPCYTSFSGMSGLTGSEILVKFTYLGDFNLDGKVTPLDFALLDAGYAGAKQADGLPGWFFGDANYDGRVDTADITLLNQGMSAYSGSGFTVLPEPSSLVLGAVGVLVLFALRGNSKLL